MKLSGTALVIAIIIIFFSACSGGSDGENNEKLVQISGSWKLECHSRSDDPFYYTVTNFEIQDGILEVSGTNYDDSDCLIPTTSDIDETFSIIHEFTLGEDVQTITGVTATELDLHNIERDGEPTDINFYTIFYVDGDVLYLGKEEDELDASSPALRPNSLDFDFPYIKQ